ncbi:hypothetical protein EVAR_58079_1 [Eumeta japonica]|uniref:Uncharacterized protein n=1 Tax=Eumeta variegata TaxID=151549 RepID=A0A4C1ZEM3_EUMVA|nr:hypothetical protein EVAR_58079_1 [Eumeta japonica]
MVTRKNIDAVHRMIETDRRIIYHEIPAFLGIGMNQIQSFIHKHRKRKHQRDSNKREMISGNQFNKVNLQRDSHYEGGPISGDVKNCRRYGLRRATRVALASRKTNSIVNI